MSYEQGRTNPERQVAQGIKFCAEGLNMFGSTEWNVMLPFSHQEFCVGSYFFRKIVGLWL
jgi:hypothetical protein